MSRSRLEGLNPKIYSTLFFDLDQTLWDFKKNSVETLEEVYSSLNIARFGPEFEQFLPYYEEVNERYWALYRESQVTIDELRIGRFFDALLHFKIENKRLAKELSQEYMSICPNKTHLIDNAFEVLDNLHAKYDLQLITNGKRHIQERKLKNSKLGKYFSSMITSDEAGVLKPNKLIFDYALKQGGLIKENVIYIGDSYDVDVVGADQAGWDVIYFPHNKEEEVKWKWTIFELKDLLTVF